MSDIDYTTERWLPVAMPGYQDFYDVSDHGRVRSRKFGKIKILGPQISSRNYHRVSLYLPGKPIKQVWIHRLVALAFIGPQPTTQDEIAHNDGVPNNNHVSNLRWANRKENAADMALHKTVIQGEQHRFAKLSEADVANIYKLREDGLRLREIAQHYGITDAAVSSVLRGNSWKFLNNPILIGNNRGENHGHAKLKNTDVLRIHELRSLGHTHIAIANMYGLIRQHVTDILRGKRWPHLHPALKDSSESSTSLQPPL